MKHWFSDSLCLADFKMFTNLHRSLTKIHRKLDKHSQKIKTPYSLLHSL